MAIPTVITSEHVLQAIDHIKAFGVPTGRQSRKFHLVHEGRSYPPKYVVSLACEFATGEMLDSEQFSGGAETNGFLAGLGFRIVGPDRSVEGVGREARRPDAPSPRSPRKVVAGAIDRPSRQKRGRHDERCPVCKQQVAELLRRIYGTLAEAQSFDVPAHPDALLSQQGIPALSRVWRTLAGLRGHADFVRSRRLRPCDYYVPDPGFVVEFDESQHFTAARAAALREYPPDLVLGFDKERWIKLCETIDAHDNDPPDRDEQRAWYDTLRDFLPLVVGDMPPTVRICARDMAWCELDPENTEDLATFRDWAALPCRFQIEPRCGSSPSPYWARAIVAGPWYGGTLQAQRLLEAVCGNWPEGTRSKVLVTCGGFLSFRWPEPLTRQCIGDNREPNPEALDIVFQEADRAVDALLTEALRSRLRRCTDVVTIGIDTFKTQISTSSERIQDLHAELVYVVDLRDGRVWRTGKSYPTCGQEGGLVRIPDVSSHLVELDGESVLVLGCHDLNAFSPRGNAVVKDPWRKGIIRDFHDLARVRLPVAVVHHPHETDSARIWSPAWLRLLKTAGSVCRFASAGRYHMCEGVARDPIDGVLSATVKGGAIDIVVKVLTHGKNG